MPNKESAIGVHARCRRSWLVKPGRHLIPASLVGKEEDPKTWGRFGRLLWRSHFATTLTNPQVGGEGQASRGRMPTGGCLTITCARPKQSWAYGAAFPLIARIRRQILLVGRAGNEAAPCCHGL